MKKNNIFGVVLASVLAFIMTGCSMGEKVVRTDISDNAAGLVKLGDTKKEKQEEKVSEETETKNTTGETYTVDGEVFQAVDEVVYTTSKLNVRESCSTEANIVKMLPERAKLNRVGVGEIWSKISTDEGEYYVATEYLSTQAPVLKGHLVAINAGHQAYANEEMEPIGPGAKEEKAKNSVGTQGVVTGVYEHEFSLVIAGKLKEELENRGYEVFMVRETDDVNLSNRERARMASESGAEVLINLHANGSDVRETNGAMAVCCTKNSPYVSALYEESHRLAKDVLTHFVDRTDAKDNGIWETDVMSGINWSTIPTINLEMGFMSNDEEDRCMQMELYQKMMVEGMADGLDTYFE